jgi:uncharacterized RDD family membrane protein YckC
MSLDADIPISPPPRYARFSRRLRGMMLDWAITLSVMFGAVLVAVTVGSDNFSRALGILVVIALLLYEPVLVSFTGGTLGHYLTNLRVVDERDGGNISFLKACARVVIKGLLGLYSFVILAATRRNQAIHDLLTRSTVQLRDPAKALPGQYITERSEPSNPNLPSGLRRVVVICAYLLLIFIVDTIITAGVLSPRCVNNNYCSASERLVSLAGGITLLAMAALIIALGWKGRLVGARRTS